MAETAVKTPSKTPPAPVKLPEGLQPQAAPSKPPKERKVYQSIFPTEEAAVTEAQGRTKGPRRAFKVTSPSGKAYFTVSNNEGRALGAAAEAEGFKYEEIGKAARAKKPVGIDGIMAAAQAMPSEQQKTLLEQIQKLLSGK